MNTHTPPTTPRIHPTIRRSYEGRACPCEGRGTSPPEKGESRGGHPPLSGAASRSGGCAPSYEKKPPRAGGWAQPTSQCRPKVSPWRLPLHPPGRLVSLCRFRAIFRRDPRPSFGPRPARYDLFPFFDRFNTPQRGPRPLIRPMPGRYDLSPFVDLSIAPQSQAAPRPSRHGPDGKLRAHHSAQIKSSRGGRGDVRGWGGPGPARLPG